MKIKIVQALVFIDSSYIYFCLVCFFYHSIDSQIRMNGLVIGIILVYYYVNEDPMSLMNYFAGINGLTLAKMLILKVDFVLEFLLIVYPGS
jgi:hypothetical protein